MISERTTKKGETRYMVRVHRGGSIYKWVGTFDNRQAAEQAELHARPRRKRQCVRCGRKFTPKDDRRIRCQTCLPPKRADDYWVYRCYTRKGELLYVGITCSGVKRLRRHGNEKDWWSQVRTITLDHCASKHEAEAVERGFIKVLRPKFNVDYNGAANRDARRRGSESHG